MNRLPPIRIVVMLMAAVLLASGGITMWSRSMSQGTKANYEKLLKEVPDESVLQKMVSETQVVVDDYESQLQHLEMAVPSLAYVPTLLTELEDLATQHNIVVTGVRPIIANRAQKSVDDKAAGTLKKKPAYEEMSIDITGRGTYENVMQMVEAIKKFPKIVAIQTIALVPRRESAEEKKDGLKSNGIVLDATVRIKTYLFPIPTAGSDGKTEAGGSS